MFRQRSKRATPADEWPRRALPASTTADVRSAKRLQRLLGARGVASLSSGGRPIDRDVRGSMEELFLHPFGGVRIHTDAAAGKTAVDLHALAYTIGENIVFAPNQYRTGSVQSHSLLVHELSHVLQHRRGRGGANSAEMSRPGDAWESSASRTAAGHPNIGSGSPPLVLRQPPGHQRGHAGEQQMGFGSYSAENGWAFVEGPSGAAGHGTTQPGPDGVAYNVRTGEVHILDNKSWARTGVGKATAIDPTANLLKNLDKLIAKVQGMSPEQLPYRQRVLRSLRQTRAALRSGGQIPGRVRMIVTNAVGRSTHVTARLERAGVEFVDVQRAAPAPGTPAAAGELRAGHPEAARPGTKRPAFGRPEPTGGAGTPGPKSGPGKPGKSEFTPGKPIYPGTGTSGQRIQGRGRSRFKPKGAGLADLLPSAMNVLQDISIRHAVASQMLSRWAELEGWRRDHPSHVIVTVVALQEWERPDPAGQVARSVHYVRFYHGATAEGALAQWDNELLPAPPSGFQLVGPFIATIEPSEDLDEVKEKVEEQEACFIATVCHGTRSAESVVVLRIFRDQALRISTPGRLFIRWYYRAAPAAARFLSQHYTTRTITRVLLVDPAARLAKVLLRHKGHFQMQPGHFQMQPELNDRASTQPTIQEHNCRRDPTSPLSTRHVRRWACDSSESLRGPSVLSSGLG
jgi:Domain of unknown function (DUF4157)